MRDVPAVETMQACLLGGALGDMLGAPVEFDPIGKIRLRFGWDGLREPVPAFGKLGAITDDTQMTLFTLEGLIRANHRFRGRGVTSVPTAVYHAYLRWLYTQGQEVPSGLLTGWLVTEPELHARRAPGTTCLSALREGAANAAGTRAAFGTPEQKVNDSKGCGGVMRVAPLALGPFTAEDAFRYAAEAAAITHGHPSGYLSAGAFAALLRLLADGADLPAAIAGARELLVRWDGHQEQAAALDAAVALAARGRPTPEQLESLGGGWVGEEALAIAVCAALSAGGDDPVTDGLRLAVNHSGDSDSTGSLCGNILGLLHGRTAGVAALPANWLAVLELRGVIETLAADAHAEFTGYSLEYAAEGSPPVERLWRVRYPGD